MRFRYSQVLLCKLPDSFLILTGTVVRKACIPLLTVVYFEFVNRYSLRNAVFCCQHTLLSIRTAPWLSFFCPWVQHNTVVKQFASPSSSIDWLLTFFLFILILGSVRRLWRFLLLGGLPESDFQQGQRTFSPPPKIEMSAGTNQVPVH
jgi:hypothetical protein